MDMDEPALPDSTIMDSTMEDLFGDAGDSLNVNVAMASASLPTATALRVAEMQSRGCCTKLAWSNTGCIAHVAPDGSAINFRTLVRDARTAAWTISDESKHPLEAPEGRKFVHMQFSGMGTDLAVVDNFGTVYPHVATGVINRMIPSTMDAIPANPLKSEVDGVVGMHWLPLSPAEFKSPCVDAGIKNGGKWEFTTRAREGDKNPRAHNPAEARNALLYISRSGELTLMYQNESHTWHFTSVTLESVRSSDELISHADLGEDGPDVLAVTHDNSSRLRLYRISISWNATRHSRGPNMPGYFTVAPTLEVRHVTSSDNVRTQQADAARLTHLRLIPTTPEAASGMPNSITIVAIFSQISFPAETTEAHGSFSVISRWLIDFPSPSLHDSFKKLKPGGDSLLPQKTMTVLRRQTDIVTNKVVLTFDSQMFDTILAFATSDGAVEFRDRVGMEPLQFTGETNRVANLPQTGFEYLPSQHNAHIALSSDAAAMVVVRQDGKFEARIMTLSPGWQIHDDGMSDNDALVSAAEACIARQYVSLCYNNASNDESLALLPLDVNLEVRLGTIRNILKLMNRSPDLAVAEVNRQQTIAFREPLLPRALSAQLALGTNPISGERDFQAQLAFISLNLKAVAMALGATMMRPDAKVAPSEVFTCLSGPVQWTTDVFVYILDSLVNMKRSLEPGTTARQAFTQLVSTNNSTAGHLLFCTFSRTLLRFTASLMGKYFQCVQQAVLPRARTISEKQDLLAVVELAQKTPFRYHEFEKLVVEFDQVFRQAWTAPGLSTEWRGDVETAMMSEGAIPDELEAPINTLMDTLLPRVMENMDTNKLFFWDTEWSGIANSKPPAGKGYYDIHRKVPIAPGTPLRVCRRCGSVMEDFPPEKARELPNWLAHAQRHCVCMCFWMTGKAAA